MTQDEALQLATAKQALDDIAKGMVPSSEMPSLDDRHAFRYAMWQWSQKRAREGLKDLETETCSRPDGCRDPDCPMLEPTS